jgi:hypothetical protein
VLPFTALGARVGLVAPPVELFALLAGLTAVYLGVVELVKRGFYRHAARPSR